MNEIPFDINSMIINKDKITDILVHGREYFFKYDNKVGGVLKREDGIIVLSYYPQFYDVRDIEHCLLTKDNCEIFSSNKISFKNLYTIISQKK